MLTIMEKVDLLQNSAIFREVRTQSLARIAAIAVETRLEAQQALFEEDEAAGEMFVLLEGGVSMTRAGRVEGTLGELQVAGALALLGNRSHRESARTSQATLALRIGQQDLYDAMAEDFMITRGILRSLVQMATAD